MNSRFQLLGFSGNQPSLNAFGSANNVRSGVNYFMDTTLRLHSPAALYSSNTKGTKRKWDVVEGTEGPEDDFSLALGIGHSPSSSDNSKMSSTTAYTLSSTKETDEETSMDLDLNFRLHLGSDSTPSPKKSSAGTEKASETVPVSYLQLSLSTGQPTSVITNTCTSSVSIHHQKSLEESVFVNAVTPADDGSTSIHQRSGVSLLPPLDATKTDEFLLNQTVPTMVDPTPVNLNTSLVAAQASKSSVTCSSGTTHTQHQRNTNTKICQFQGCGKGARGASGLCIAHGGGRRCQREGCHKGAEGRTIYCKAHGGGRRCQFLGCTKSAEGRTDYCIGHGGGRRCSHEGCTRASRGKSGLCIRHGGGKRCQRENCTKSAEGYTGLCISHGGGRRCKLPDCTKGAQGSTMFCKAHGGGKRCTVLGCMKGAEGSTPFCKGHGGGKRCFFQGGGVCTKSVHGGTQFCVAHGGGKRCAVSECTRSARGRTNFCVRHGGGKRCKSEGCGKSAQGRTDFCKAHGGGKRCSWGQACSEFSNVGPPCDRFARSKTGLCAAHSALVHDYCVHGGGSLGPVPIQNLHITAPEKMKDVATGQDMLVEMAGHGQSFLSWSGFNSEGMHPAIPQQSGAGDSEGRVHGASNIAMLGGIASIVGQTGGHAGAGPSQTHAWSAAPSQPNVAYVMPHKWV